MSIEKSGPDAVSTMVARTEVSWPMEFALTPGPTLWIDRTAPLISSKLSSMKRGCSHELCEGLT